MYITREFEDIVLKTFEATEKRGLILAGIVGCGKTTLVQHCQKELKTKMRVFEFTGDDLKFRTAIAENSRYLFEEVTSRTDAPSLIFVDEVQKSEPVFDALKYAFDHGNISFLVTGSNPEYLATVARKRLQRRADFMTMTPFSLPEILIHNGLLTEGTEKAFTSLLCEATEANIPSLPIRLTAQITALINRYLSVGGLPLAHLSSGQDSFLEVRKTVERGFEIVLLDSRELYEKVLVELARVHSREFTYTNLFKKTGIRRREQVNKVIQQLKGHGYLVSKKPFFFSGAHRSYLTVHSYIDPGILSYLLGDANIDETLGHRIEGVVHSRLAHLIQQIPFRTDLGYYKPYQLDKDGDIKFLPGEIDFVFSQGKRRIPIEVKATPQVGAIDTSLMSSVIEKYQLPFGIILYGGTPLADRTKKLVFWPWWAV